MPGPLTHSPADVVRHALIGRGAGTLPSVGQAWPIQVAAEQEAPDNHITLYGTSGVNFGREMVEGEQQENHGIQVRVRGATHPAGYAKARALALHLDAIYDLRVTIDGQAYNLHCVNRMGDVIDLGRDPTSTRYLFTINALVSVRQV